MKLKAAVYDPYLDTLGGGERYCLTVAEILLKNNYDVDIFWSGDPNLLKIAQERFSLELNNLKIVPDIFHLSVNSFNLIEDNTSVAKNVNPPKVRDNSIEKINKFIKKIKVSQQYDVIFYLSDGSLPFIKSNQSILHAQVPLQTKITFFNKINNFIKLMSFRKVVCNSKFTSNVIDKYYSKKSIVLYPPVDVQRFFNSENKQKIIISVGRFDNLLNSKKQDVLITAFRNLFQNKANQSWKLILAGGSTQTAERNSYLKHLQFLAQGLPVEFHLNPSFEELKALYSSSSIYWHAAGYGVDQIIHPENTEHFGISVVEAMAAGAVPLVVSKGGLPEIVQENLNGYLWNTPDDLISKTQLLIGNPTISSRLSSQAIKDSNIFSKSSFEASLLGLLTQK